ncbi:MAG: DUF72 domain-containing protein [Chloroflexi bacterium]|nr:DUF72 domain-containing protein [Chloroflexota bacterium]
MSGRCFVGTSGWIYPHWRGVFYPATLPTSQWFGYYARYFGTVEINNSFYHLPSEAAFRAWHKQAPASFIYAVKANRFITHMRKLRDPEGPLEKFLPRARLLNSSLGPILYQLPPHWRRNVERLQAFCQLLPKDMVHVFEFRDPSWFHEETFAVLAAFGAAFCIVSLPDFTCPIRVTGSVVYIRMHGSATLYGSKYTEDELRAWAAHILRFRSEGHDIYIYFNNDAFGYAAENALRLREIVEGSR